MKLSAIALDYDGTIAENGALSPETRASIERLRAAGIVVIVVTGRRLSDLRTAAGTLGFADAVVAENGAVVAFPHSGQTRLLASAPPVAFVDALRHNNIPVGVGHCIVESAASYAPGVLSLIRSQSLPLAILFNRDRLMVLPQGVSKATGLQAVLRELQISAHNTVGVGDAENDHALLHACGLGVAVAWGNPALIAAADAVVPGMRPADVSAYLRGLAGQIPAHDVRVRRSAISLGRTRDGRSVAITPEGQNILIAGDSVSGKSWIAGLLSEQWLAQGFSICVIDPEGDYAALQAIPDVVSLGKTSAPPALSDVVSVLRHPDVSLVVDLSHLPCDEKAPYVGDLLSRLTTLRHAIGRPHQLIVDEAHYFLGELGASFVDLGMGGNVFVTYRSAFLPEDIRNACAITIATRVTHPGELSELRHRSTKGEDPSAWVDQLPTLSLGEAILLPSADGSVEAARFQLRPRQTDHVRHRMKYLNAPVRPGRRFVFTENGEPTGRQADTVRALALHIRESPDEVLAGHLSRGDFSRWIEDVYADHPLARSLRALESVYSYEAMSDIRNALCRLIEDRYAALDEIFD